MLNLITIATKPQALSEQLNLQIREKYTPAYQARPGMVLPIIISSQSKPVLINARWGCETETATMSLSTFPMDRILTQPPFNRWIHTQRCLIPANCFFARNSDEKLKPDDPHIYLVRLLQSRLFLIGGLFTIERASNGKERYSFLLLTTESADVLRTMTDNMPVILPSEHLNLWLTSEHLIDIMHLTDRSGDQWFDYFPVSSDILTPGVNNRNLLKPLDTSFREKEERQHKLKAIDVKQDRFDRRGGKW